MQLILKHVLVIIVIFILASCKSSKSKEAKPPNIIFLLADDLRADAIGFMGNSIIKTPNLDALANKGVVFNNAYVTTSICAVSRASILSGQYARKHNVWGFSKDFTETQLQDTYPMVLKKSGYVTGFVGKYGVGHNAPKDKFNFWAGFNGQGSFKQADVSGKSIHLTSKMAQQAKSFIQAQQNNKAPFCLSVSFKAPHVEGDPGYFLPDNNYSQLYKNDSIKIPLTASKAFFNHYPDTFTKNNVGRNRWQDRFATNTDLQENIKKYYRLITGIDSAVGEIIETLKITGKTDNTVIIFTSDNGFYLGEYGLAGKWYGSNPSIKIPLLIADLRTQQTTKKVVDNMVLNIDFAPTILNYAGVTIPNVMQGKSILEVLENPNAPWRDRFFYEHLWQSSKRYYIPSTEGIVFKDKKYMRYFKNMHSDSLVFEEMYHLKKDPNETNNIIHNTAYKNLKDSLLADFKTIKHKANY